MNESFEASRSSIGRVVPLEENVGTTGRDLTAGMYRIGRFGEAGFEDDDKELPEVGGDESGRDRLMGSCVVTKTP